MKQYTPLSQAQFQILLSLADEARHGYGIMQEVAERSGDKIQLGPGTLYGNVKKMMADGLIEESQKPAGVEDDDPRRRYYKLTEQGQKVAIAEARRLADMVHDARIKNLLPEAS